MASAPHPGPGSTRETKLKIRALLEEHIDRVAKLRRDRLVTNRELLTNHVWKASGIPRETRSAVARLPELIRKLVTGPTFEVANAAVRIIRETITTSGWSYKEQYNAFAMVERDRQRIASFESLILTLEVFAEYRHDLHRRLQAADPEESMLVLKDAILAYEMADLAVAYVTSTGCAGDDLLKRCHKDYQQSRDNTRRSIADLRRRANGHHIQLADRNRALKEADDDEKALEIADREWSFVLEDRSLRQALNSVGETLELLRAEAISRLDALEALAVLPAFRENTARSDKVLSIVRESKLVPLDAVRVRRLLGLRPEKKP